MEEKPEKFKKMANRHYHGGDAVYGLGLIGALVYYLQNATTLQEGLIGILKALTWPAFLVYKLLTILKF